MSVRPPVKLHQRGEDVDGVWNYDGLDAPGGHLESRMSDKDFENKDLSLESDLDLPAAMESEVYFDGRIHIAGQENLRARPKPIKNLERFTRGLKGCWKTASLMSDEDFENNDMKARILIRELIIYVVYLAVLLVVTFGMTSMNEYHFTKVIQGMVNSPFAGNNGTYTNSFTEMATTQEFWMFLEGPLLSGLYSDWEKYYNLEDVSSTDKGYIFYENKMLGVPRLRQLKVKNGTCVVNTIFVGEINECFAPYSSDIEEKDSFGKMNGSAWVYHTEMELDGSKHAGKAASYSGAGFYADLSHTSEASAAIIADLKENTWIDRATRVVFIDFSLYNANINLFCIVRLTVEFLPSGGVITSSTYRILKLLRYVTIADYCVLGCEIFFIAFILYYVVEECLEIKKHKLNYFNHIWNWMDISIIGVALVCIGFNIARYILVDKALTNLLNDPNKFVDFEFLSYWSVNYNYAVAFVSFLSWIKIFKYLSFNKTMSQLNITLGKSKNDLVGFTIMFLIILYAFSELGSLLFGTQLEDYSANNSWFTLLRVMLGDFDYQSLEVTNSVLGPLYFTSFVFVAFFILMNMFIAIVNDSYMEVKAEIAASKNDIELGNFFKQQYNKMMSKVNVKKEKIHGVQRALKSADKDANKKIDFKEFKADLILRGYTDDEINTVFTKYDINGDKILSEKEQIEMQQDLEGARAEIARETDDIEERIKGTDYNDDDDDGNGMSINSRKVKALNGVVYEEFAVLRSRVEKMEQSIGSIVSKIDGVLVKLEAMEKAKLKRKDSAISVLDRIDENQTSLEEQNYSDNQVSAAIVEEDNLDDDDEPI